jgi:parallel beta-helix repeat protein
VGISAETAGRGLRNVVRGCTITGTGASRASAEENNPGCGVFVWGLGHVDGTVIDGNTIEDNGGHGIAVIDGKNGTISGNDVARNGWSGIGLAWSEASGTVIERNRVRENCRHVDDCFGINLFRTGNDNVVRYNTVHAQHDTLHDPGVPINEGYPRKYGTGGIRFDGGDPTLGVGSDYLDASGNRAYYNVVFAEYVGIDVFNFGNVDLADNVVADATSQGIVVMASNLERRPVTGTRVVNNVVFRSAEQHFVHVDAESSTLDHNLYFPDGASLFRFARESVDVTTDFAGFRARTGGEAHSLVADPLFLGAETNDYHLEEESPAVDAGMDVGLATDMDGSAVPWGEAVDIGAFEWRTGGGEDGGDGGADGGEDGGADGADAGGDGDADGDAAGADGDAAGTDGDADGDTAGADGGDGGGPSGPGESCGCGGAGAARGGMPGALAAAVLAVVPILASRRVRRRARGARPGRAYSSTTAQTCTSGCSTSTSPCNSAT